MFLELLLLLGVEALFPQALLMLLLLLLPELLVLEGVLQGGPVAEGRGLLASTPPHPAELLLLLLLLPTRRLRLWLLWRRRPLPWLLSRRRRRLLRLLLPSLSQHVAAAAKQGGFGSRGRHCRWNYPGTEQQRKMMYM